MANPPTSDKPQSKLWWNAGSWWADMWTTASGGWHIFQLNRGTETWVDTGVSNDTRSNTLSDTLWDGTHLYIASHVVTISTTEAPVDSVSNQPAKLYRYSYANGTYTLDSGFPTQITNNSSESLTIDEDSTGALWSTWTQVAGSGSTATNTVYVNDSAPGGTSWGTPFVIPAASDPNPSPDDISSVVSYAGAYIGVMWTDQTSGTVWWDYRKDGTSPTAAASWHAGSAVSGSSQADDHLDLKTLQADNAGRVFAAVKTSLNDTSTNPANPQLLLLVFTPGSGFAKPVTISTVGDCVTRPQVVLDSQNNQIHVFQTAPPASTSGCAFSGVAGAIYEKTASTTNPVFPTGRGTTVIEDVASENLNNATTSKQTVNSATGLVVMASNDVSKQYWFADLALGGTPAAPVAAFTATPTSGTAPVTTQFTDTSSGAPTSWAWTFGDGATSTAQNPSHTYTTAGTYTVTLKATNATGSNTSTRTGLITVTAAQTAPTASFTATPTSGTAPVTTQFTDTSTGSPTSWAWTFGDGGTSTAQNPSHTYTAAGTYTVALTATNATGSNTSTRTGLITVTAAQSGHVSVGASTSSGSTTAVTGVALVKPTGVTAGDVLVATFTSDATPSVSSAPAGWTTVLSPLSISTGAKVFVYYHVVSSPASEPAGYSWTLSAAEKWNGGITDYAGVNTAAPFDGSAVSKVDSTYNATSLSLPGVTTTSSGDVLIGGIGMDSTGSGFSVTKPAAWTEAYDAIGGQLSEQASVAEPTAGATGTATWTFSAARAVAGWSIALKPAS